MVLDGVKAVGFTGPLASGKGVLTDKLKEDGWPYLSLSQIVRDEATQQKVEHTRDNLISIGNKLRADYGLGILAKRTISKIEQLAYGMVVIDGIRNPYEVDELRAGISKFFLIGVDAPAELRYERALARARTSDPAELEKLKAADERDIAIGIYDCIQKSDVVICNANKTIAELHKELYDIMQQNKL
ncbi:MAG: AAA family ATPase [DPANN group archaeon]|nr:AAA family ATPase [DPANN group archaeon]